MTRNAAALTELADFLAREKTAFDMRDPRIPECGSAGCIGATAALIWPEVRSYNDATWNDAALARKLGLGSKEHGELCYASASARAGLSLGDISRADAIHMLRKLARGEPCVWEKAP